MNLYPGGNTRTNAPFDLCKNNGIVAIGWSEINRHITTTSPVKYAKSAERIIPRAYPKRKGEFEKWRRQFETLAKVEKGDLVWTKRSRGHFFLNRILDSKVTPLNGEDYLRFDFGSGRKCDWNEVNDYTEVPAEIKRNTRGTIRSVKDTKGKALGISERLYNELKREAAFHPRPFRGNWFDFLAPEDVEDIVGLFLQAKKNLLVVPSSSKQSTSPVEFVMITRDNGEEVGVQVKTGEQEINLDDYKDAPKKCYFFQQKPRSEWTGDENTIFIKEKELTDFATRNPNLLPKSLRRLVLRFD